MAWRVTGKRRMEPAREANIVPLAGKTAANP